MVPSNTLCRTAHRKAVCTEKAIASSAATASAGPRDSSITPAGAVTASICRPPTACTDDGAFVLFVLDGRTPPAHEDKRRILASVLFESDDERYQWLNSAVCVLEGDIRVSGTAITRIYTCVHELG